MTDILPVRRALLSVSDKTGLVEFATALTAQGAEILSTGGSAAALKAAGIEVTEVEAHTGFPEMMDGRVKTLHPKIHGGLLALRDDPKHRAAMTEHGILPIDLVAVSLYPFEATVARGAGFAETIENIDIGGPAMIRSAAKNHRHVAVVTDRADYGRVMDELAARGGLSLATRRTLAAAAFARTAAYDAAIAGWFADHEGETFPKRRILALEHATGLRYGENPHQAAALYRAPLMPRAGVMAATQIQGKELSYNNINDADAAAELLAELDRDRPAVVIVKHANPCGVAYGDSLKDAWRRALSCDPVSAFGGIVAMNRPLDAATAEAIAQIFTEVILAPDADAEARTILGRKKNLRLLIGDMIADPAEPGLAFRQVAGGFLVQERDSGRIDADALRVVTKRTPDPRELADLLFAFRVAKHVKSNAIVYARDGMTVGIGAGQMNRRDSSRIAAIRAAEAAEAAGEDRSLAIGSVVASDAFFPFADGLVAAAEAGATAVIQPGGSLRDEEVIAAADERGLAMVFTGMRHFRH